MGKSIREVYGTVLAELGDTNENIVIITSIDSIVARTAGNGIIIISSAYGHIICSV